MASWIKDFLILTLVIGTLFGVNLAKYPISAPDGGRYAEIPREMVATQDYITPHLNGVKYFEKPPLFYWMQAASIKVFGVNDFAVSLVNALAALGIALFVYFASRKLYGRFQGIVSSFIFATSALVFALTRAVTIDMVLTFFLTGSLSLFLLATRLPISSRRTIYLLTSYFLAGCAVMTKGLVGIVFLGLIALVWFTICNKWRDLKTYKIISGIFIFLLVTLPWHILVQIKNPEFFNFYFTEQHFLRYATNYAGRSQKWWFFPAFLIAGLYPWLTFLPQAIASHIPKHLKEWRESQVTIFLLTWIVVIYVFYSFSNSKLIPYILPIFPPIAMFLGNYFVKHWQNRGAISVNIGFNLLSILNLILGAGTFAATFKLDFAEQALTKQNLYVISVMMLILAIASQIAYRRHKTSSGFITIVIITSFLWLYISPIITVINRQSIKPLIVTLQQKLKPEDEVISYGAYYQDLPFYLERIITVANFAGELDFGMRHQDTSDWMIKAKEFWNRWNSDETKYLITSVDNYYNLRQKSPDKMRIVAKHFDTLLITNSK